MKQACISSPLQPSTGFSRVVCRNNGSSPACRPAESIDMRKRINMARLKGGSRPDAGLRACTPSLSLSFRVFRTPAPLVQTHLFTDELLPQELAGLEHVRDVVERTETLVPVFVLLLNRKDGKRGRGRGVGGRQGHKRKLFMRLSQRHIRRRCGPFEGARSPQTLPTETDLHTVALPAPCPGPRDRTDLDLNQRLVVTDRLCAVNTDKLRV